ncbi:C40 family peptidase [Pelomicrobium sp. G1]|uniref:C40 family peptidase n=1 Tax=unclassified Pelomicrobium TaxID=2815318 RepID=UPI003F759E6D
MVKALPRLVLIAVVVHGLGGCASAPPPRPPMAPPVASATLSAEEVNPALPGPMVQAQEAAGHATRAVRHALAMVGRPYRAGGAGPDGFDCSGLVHYSFLRAGLPVPRDTRSLLQAGRPVETEALAPGDLVFFDQEGKKASHVGIYLGRGRFVHAPSTGGRVRVDRLDAPHWRLSFSEARRL